MHCCNFAIVNPLFYHGHSAWIKAHFLRGSVSFIFVPYSLFINLVFRFLQMIVDAVSQSLVIMLLLCSFTFYYFPNSFKHFFLRTRVISLSLSPSTFLLGIVIFFCVHKINFKYSKSHK